MNDSIHCFRHKPYLYVFEPIKCVGDVVKGKIDFACGDSPRVCVDRCPNKTNLFNSAYSYDEYHIKISLSEAICVDGSQPRIAAQFLEMVEVKKCAPTVLKSRNGKHKLW